MIKVGIFFGGVSREREISFAGGRTVYDSIDKSIFEPIPIFIDGKGNFIELNWQFIYKGTIRDFFPPSQYALSSKHGFQVYAESLQLSSEAYDQMLSEIGTVIEPSKLKQHIDIAFLCLHGPYGEDGSIQGLLDFYNIPFTGSGVFASSVGISKASQKQLMQKAGFTVNKYITFSRSEFDQNPESIFNNICDQLSFPVVIKASSQGSSIGISFLYNADFEQFNTKVNHSFFRRFLTKDHWTKLSETEKVEFVRNLCDLQHGLGLPLFVNNNIVYDPDTVLESIAQNIEKHDQIRFESIFAEPEIVVEEKIKGKEFSCIVIRNQFGKIIALPPTEIRKQNDLFDYRSKYLPGITRKVTPIEIEESQIEAIRLECSQLFDSFKFDVYARIDGFITDKGEIFLNDPNTTSGMLPSSFFFHQAAEIGLNPTQFISYIIHQSLVERSAKGFQPFFAKSVLKNLNDAIALQANKLEVKTKIGVIFGGYSTERHISVESGRNVFEKLSSTGNYELIPIFLMKDNEQIRLFKVPINLLLKDNADDIKDKILNFKTAPIIHKIIDEASNITEAFTGGNYEFNPVEIPLEKLNENIDFAFMALHGRPGEDGTLQQVLEAQKIPYNGSGPQSSSTTIDKYQTNEILRKNGILVAKHDMVWKENWLLNQKAEIEKIENELPYPFIAKPADDGCSSAVKKINNREELINFATVIFRNSENLTHELAELLKLKINEEFPVKQGFLIEELISANGAAHFIEVTGGMLTKANADGSIEFEVFEASESVAEEGILTLEEKFLAGEGQNITPARYATNIADNIKISNAVRAELKKVAQILNVEGYCRIDAFVRIYSPDKVEVIIIEINSLPGLTPATCIFHQAAINSYKPAQFLEQIISYGNYKNKLLS